MNEDPSVIEPSKVTIYPGNWKSELIEAAFALFDENEMRELAILRSDYTMRKNNAVRRRLGRRRWTEDFVSFPFAVDFLIRDVEDEMGEVIGSKNGSVWERNISIVNGSSGPAVHLAVDYRWRVRIEGRTIARRLREYNYVLF